MLRRILMAADSSGGMWTYAMELSRGLSSHGYDVHLAVTGATLDSSQREMASSISNLTIYESPHRSEWATQSQAVTDRVGLWILNLEREIQPDVVHLNDLVLGALSWSSPLLLVGHSCVYSWFAAVKRSKPPVEWEGYRNQVRRGLRAADAVMAPTNWMLDTLATHYGAFRSLPCVYHGRSAVYSGHSDKEAIILTSGRLWDEAKNVSALDRVVSQLEWPVYVIGDEPHSYPGNAPAAGARRLGKLTAHEVGQWMQRAAIFALPARYEPFGMSVLEAALAGCALVLGDIPSLREIWGDAAVYVAPDELPALQRALQQLISDESYRAEIAARARTRASELNPESMTAGYIAAYEAAIRNYRRTRASVPDEVRREASASPVPA